MVDSFGPAGRDFESRVGQLYGALGYAVDHNVRRHGQQIDILARRDIEGLQVLSVAVECKDWTRPVGNQEVQNFVASVAALRLANAVDAGVMVSAQGFTADAKSVVAEISWVTLLSIADLEARLLDVRAGMRLFVNRYRSQDIFTQYVEIDAHRSSWVDPVGGQQDVAIRGIAAAVVRWIREGRLSNVFLLADYGAGKSTILRRIQYQLCQEALDGDLSNVPVFVALKAYYETEDLSLLLRNAIREDYLRDVPTELLWQNIDAGTMVLLLDGFDEMAARSDEARRFQLFQRLLPLVNSPCPTVLSSRPSLFVAKGELQRVVDEIRESLTPLSPTPPARNTKARRRFETLDRLKTNLLRGVSDANRRTAALTVPPDDAVTVVALLPLDETKVERYISQRFGGLDSRTSGDSISAEEVIAFVDRVYDLSDLASGPSC